MRRIMLIARRDFFGYVKTFGFWITVISPFFGIALGVLMSSLSLNAQPLRYVTILDETGRYEAQIVAGLASERERIERELLTQSARLLLTGEQREALDQALDEGGVAAARIYIAQNNFTQFDKVKAPGASIKIIPPPAATFDALMPFIKGEQTITIDGAQAKLSGALHIVEGEEQIEAKYWTVNPSAQGPKSYADRLLRREAEDMFFDGTGKTVGQFWTAREDAPSVQVLNPNKPVGADGGGQRVTFADKIPNIVAAAFSAFLWLSVFSGAYMLLMSMVEEKINKALEMLLASTRFSEILFGKLIGVAALTIASMLPWLLLGGAGVVGFVLLGDSAIATALSEAVSGKMVGLFLVFFILGYIFYGALFMAMGALAESMQDAQTLVTPVLIVLTLCVMVVPIGLATPDSALVRAASFIPLSAPFAVLIRLPSDPPLWEIIVPALILLLSTIAVVWGAARIFRYGILSGGGLASVKYGVMRLFRAFRV